MAYVGRFAPSPTGDLHLGTLTAAVASFLHARQSAGEWRVRIEDVDPPREVPGSADSILRTLERLDLEWDGAVVYQSHRHESYIAAKEALLAGRMAFYCECSRRTIRKLSGGARYPGTCRNRNLTPGDKAVRLRAPREPVVFEDLLQGRIARDIEAEDGDFVIFRRDGLPAYHLAVVVDDAAQSVTDIVRGVDLLDSTPLHIHLQRALGLPTPRYWHIPLVRDATGEKLSKGTGATAVESMSPSEAAVRALEHLGLAPPAELLGAPPRSLWQWAGAHWDITALGAGHDGPAREA
jgi:glutamyl-Q tRNA(Asp) synthetase